MTLTEHDWFAYSLALHGYCSWSFIVYIYANCRFASVCSTVAWGIQLIWQLFTNATTTELQQTRFDSTLLPTELIVAKLGSVWHRISAQIESVVTVIEHLFFECSDCHEYKSSFVCLLDYFLSFHRKCVFRISFRKAKYNVHLSDFAFQANKKRCSSLFISHC